MQLENMEKAARAVVYLDKLENLKANFTREGDYLPLDNGQEETLETLRELVLSS